MKKFIRIISYIREYKAYMAWYSLFITLSIVFGLFSLGMLMPFMDLIFQKGELTGVINTATASGGAGNIKEIVYGFLQQIIDTHGKVTALGWICLAIIINIFLKNSFLYLSFYFLAPIRNGVTRKYSRLLYEKILNYLLAILQNNAKEIS